MKSLKKMGMLLLSLVFLAGCQDTYEPSPVQEVENTTAEKAVLVEDTEKRIIIEAREDMENLAAALDWLQDEGLIQFVNSGSDTDFYITGINGLEASDGEKTYWALYTTLLEKDGVTYATLDSGTLDVEDQQLGYASYGASDLPFVKGNLYAFAYETY